MGTLRIGTCSWKTPPGKVRIVRPKDKDHARILPELVTLVDALDEVCLNVNNHYEGSAPLTIEKIREAWKW